MEPCAVCWRDYDAQDGTFSSCYQCKQDLLDGGTEEMDEEAAFRTLWTLYRLKSIDTDWKRKIVADAMIFYFLCEECLPMMDPNRLDHLLKRVEEARS